MPEQETKDTLQSAPSQATSDGETSPSRLAKIFKNVAGTALAGATLTTGFGMFIVADISSGRRGAEITSKLIDMTSLFTSHMTVWTAAIALGAIGWYAGKHFDSPEKKFKARGTAAALGISLIAASFAWPVGDKIYDAVHDGLSGNGNKVEQSRSLTPF